MDQKKLSLMISNLHGNLVQISMAPLLILIVISPELFSFVFGDNWQQAGIFARWMSPMLFAAFVIIPISTGILQVREQQSNALLFQVILLLARVAGISFGALVSNVSLSVILFSLNSAACYFFLLLWICRTNFVSIFLLIKSWCTAFFWSVLIVIPLLSFMFIFKLNLILGLILSIVFLSVRYYCLLMNLYPSSSKRGEGMPKK